MTIGVQTSGQLDTSLQFPTKKKKKKKKEKKRKEKEKKNQKKKTTITIDTQFHMLFINV
jgi:hypothetical protein